MTTFTRYLYNKTEVKHSLLFALFDRCREEALFWTYELYFSGFEDELVEWLRWVYRTFYAIHNTRFTNLFETILEKLYESEYSIERDCLVGSIVSNLVHRAYTIQTFTLEYLEMDIKNVPIHENNHPFVIRFCPRDIEPYQTKDISEYIPSDYLRHVSRYSIRKNQSMFLQKHGIRESSSFGDFDSDDSVQYTNKYLHNWLFHISNTPYWKSILEKYPSFRVDVVSQTATFTCDDDIESFYEQYGLEPDEQPIEIHLAHGIDVHRTGIFTPMTTETFYVKYSGGDETKVPLRAR